MILLLTKAKPLHKQTQSVSPIDCPLCHTHYNLSSITSSLLSTNITMSPPSSKKPSIDPSIPVNYHPLPLLPFVDKLCEKAIYNRCIPISHSLLNLLQSCWPHHSTKTAPSKVPSDLLTAKSNGLFSIFSLYDLSVASDTAHHSLLLEILFSIDFHDTTLSWVSYLSEPSFSSLLCWILIELTPINHGYPTGLCPSLSSFISLYFIWWNYQLPWI